MSKAANGIDILISFDTTGSMYPCLQEVRSKIQTLVASLFDKLPRIGSDELRIGVIVHGDYCDEGAPYVIQRLDLCSDRSAVIEFVRKAKPTGGGDAPECYELVLNEARSATWRAGKSRVLVLIGDDIPHPSSYRGNVKKLDWRNEARMLAETGIQVYSVQCLNRSHATAFYREVAEITGGQHLRLNQFGQIEHILLGIAYRQVSVEALNAYVEDITATSRVSLDTRDVFDILAGRELKRRGVRSDGLVPIDPARFQSFSLGPDEELSLREFAEDRNLTFMFQGNGSLRTGLIFHAVDSSSHGKAEVRPKHHIVIEDLESGEWFTGAPAREMLGVPYGTSKKLSPNPLGSRYRVWKQSTSPNHKLMPNTPVLVDMKPEEGFEAAA